MRSSYFRAVTSDLAYTRLTRVMASHEEMPAWPAARFVLPSHVYQPMSFTHERGAYDLVVGPRNDLAIGEGSDSRADREWLHVIRGCLGVILVFSAEEFPKGADAGRRRIFFKHCDRALALRLRRILSGTHSIRRLVILVTKVDLISTHKTEAETQVTQLVDEFLPTVVGVLLNAGVSVRPIATTSFGFKFTVLDPIDRLPSGAQFFNILTPIEWIVRGNDDNKKITALVSPHTLSNTHLPSSLGEAPNLAFDVALSFAGEDRIYVDQVAEGLQLQGVTVFYDRYEEAALWGQDLTQRLAEVYGELSRFVVVFVSRHYADKAWPSYELRSTQVRLLQNRAQTILPARFDDTEIPGLPKTISYANLAELSPQALVARIVEKLKTIEGAKPVS
ncbi:MAG: TIR domain-containing protein [Nitrospirota bacterium]|nr:TIR domain-containing protein [Nitrospirota bacterium]MDH5585422.1 TIR domain-containing protein [Nitrospirota bacterium]MDH5774710.1 TIR domain-containing protein [Nitrospirota bacterium]